jgi:Abortive infection C-terminus
MTIGTAARAAPLTDTVIVAVSRLVDDAKVDRRDPSHSDLKFLFQQVGLADADLTTPAGKERRVRQVLSWAMEHDPDRGERLVARLIAAIKGSGGFRPGSANYVGEDAINTARATFAGEGFQLTEEGDLQPVLLQGLDDPATPIVLRSYVRRASRGAADAALVVGTGKDLLEATAAYVLVTRYGAYSGRVDFPTLLGQAFAAHGLATPQDRRQQGEPAWRDVERRLFEAGCAINRLRNKEGIGHGRPFPPNVSEAQARTAIQIMGAMAGLLLERSVVSGP